MTALDYRRQWLWPAAVVLGLLMLILVVRQGKAPPRIAPSNVIEHPPVDVDAPSLEEVVATTPHLLIYVSPGSYTAAEAAALAEPLETALAYVEERTGMRLTRKVNVVFDRHSEACGLDGAAYTEVRTLILYACPDTPTRRAINILAHEFVHQLAHDHFGAAHLQADLVLSEGLATWGAGRYWLGRERSFHDFVARQYGSGLLPLATDPRAGATTDTLNQLYYQWAAYIEWLRTTYGPDALEQLYATGAERRPGSATYTETLGARFVETEAHWQAWIKQPLEADEP